MELSPTSPAQTGSVQTGTVTSETVTSMPQAVADTLNAGITYATFGQRLVAALIDGLILWVISMGVSFFFGAGTLLTGSDNDPAALLLSLVQSGLLLLINAAYLVYFIGSRGQTPGKMAMKIKVVRIGTQDPPGYVSAFLREEIGKLLSSLLLSLGYLWMLWDDKKQTWHDKIANTVVIRA